MTVWLKLRGPNTLGMAPKGAVATGWNEPAYQGIDVDAAVNAGQWVGVRLDDFVVIDCDDEETATAWADAHGGFLHTWTRKTPHGYHFIYKRTDYALTARKLTTKSELKTGTGHQIVFHAPGYFDFNESPAIPFDSSWLPPEILKPQVEEWDQCPEGMRNSFLTSVGGKLREWGCERVTIKRVLLAINGECVGLEPREVSALARSVSKYYPAEREEIECPSCGTKFEVV